MKMFHKFRRQKKQEEYTKTSEDVSQTVEHNVIVDAFGIQAEFQKLNLQEEECISVFLRLQSPEIIEYLKRNKEVIFGLAEVLKACYHQEIRFAEHGKLHFCISTNKPLAKYGLVIGTGVMNAEEVRVDGRTINVLFRIGSFIPMPPALVTFEATSSLSKFYSPIIIQFLPWHELLKSLERMRNKK